MKRRALDAPVKYVGDLLRHAFFDSPKQFIFGDGIELQDFLPEGRSGLLGGLLCFLERSGRGELEENLGEQGLFAARIDVRDRPAVTQETGGSTLDVCDDEGSRQFAPRDREELATQLRRFLPGCQGFQRFTSVVSHAFSRSPPADGLRALGSWKNSIRRRVRHSASPKPRYRPRKASGEELEAVSTDNNDPGGGRRRGLCVARTRRGLVGIRSSVRRVFEAPRLQEEFSEPGSLANRVEIRVLLHVRRIDEAGVDGVF